MRSLLAMVLLGGLVLAGLKIVTGVGPSLPGPSIRGLFGRGGTKPLPECKLDRSRVLSPAAPATGSARWRLEPPAPAARGELKAATLNGLIYLVGGQGPEGRSLATVTTFDPRRRNYRRAPDMPERVDHPLVVTHGGALYVAGGYVDGRPTNRTWRYSAAGGWSPLEPLRVGRGALAGGVIGQHLYAVSGAPRTFPELRARPYSSVEAYDFRSGHWSFGPPIPTARHHTSATVVDGRLYVAGGRTPTDFSSNAFERLDPRRNTWQRLPPMPLGAGGVETVAAGGRVVVTGGEDEEGWLDGHGWVTGATWAFDTTRTRWTRLANLRVPRHAHAAAVANRRIYVFEGTPCPGFGRMRSAESLRVP